MICQLSARVIGKAVLRQSFDVVMPPYTIKLMGEPGGFCERIVAQKRVKVTRDELPSMTSNAHGGAALLNIPESPHFKDLIQLLQYIESIGSFEFSIRKIMWEQPERSFIPECPEEESMVTLKNITVDLEQPTLPLVCECESLALRLRDREKLSFLTIPFAFFREGMIDYEYLRYVTAFRNFYLCLEGLYSNGKTRNRDIQDEFLKSQQLMKSVEEALVAIRKQPRHLQEMQKAFSRDNWPVDAEHVMKHLVSTRGAASHFSNQSTLAHGHPLNHQEFFTPAYLALLICINVYRRCVEENTR